MRKFIHIRQLLFLLVIMAMLIIARMRQNNAPSVQKKKIKSALLDKHRSMPVEYSSHFSCLMKCREIHEEDLRNIMQYGRLQIHDDSLFFSGRSSDGRLLSISAVQDGDHILFLSMDKTDDCPCP